MTGGPPTLDRDAGTPCIGLGSRMSVPRADATSYPDPDDHFSRFGCVVDKSGSHVNSS